MMDRNLSLCTVCVLVILHLLIGCGDDDPTAPAPVQDGAGVCVSRLSVSGMPGYVDSLFIHSAGGAAGPSACTVSCDDASVASVVHRDSTVIVTAIGLGEATVSIDNGNGSMREVPVQVYDPLVLDTGDLLLRYVEDFDHRWTGAGGSDFTFWAPRLPDIGSLDWHALGQCQVSGGTDPSGRQCALVAKPDPDAAGDSPALAPPTAYTEIPGLFWCFEGMPGMFWNPVPPSGYVAMGTVVQANTAEPPEIPGDAFCVRQDLTHFGEAGTALYRNESTYSEFHHDTVQLETTCPPGKSVAIYQRIDRFVLKRHNGRDQEIVDSWEVAVYNDWLSDTYPD